jgi:hypothetical protein
MPETVEQYIARMTGFVANRDPWAILTETPGRLRSLIEGATARELAWTTAPTRWSIAQIAAHLADAEIVGAWRIRSVLERDSVVLQSYDQDVWASAFHYETAPAAESVAVFEVLRRATLRVLRTVDPSRRRHAGMHSERGPEPIDHIMRMYAGHDLNHLGQIERLLTEARQTT